MRQRLFILRTGKQDVLCSTQSRQKLEDILKNQKFTQIKKGTTRLVAETARAHGAFLLQVATQGPNQTYKITKLRVCFAEVIR